MDATAALDGVQRVRRVQLPLSGGAQSSAHKSHFLPGNRLGRLLVRGRDLLVAVALSEDGRGLGGGRGRERGRGRAQEGARGEGPHPVGAPARYAGGQGVPRQETVDHDLAAGVVGLLAEHVGHRLGVYVVRPRTGGGFYLHVAYGARGLLQELRSVAQFVEVLLAFVGVHVLGEVHVLQLAVDEVVLLVADQELGDLGGLGDGLADLLGPRVLGRVAERSFFLVDADVINNFVRFFLQRLPALGVLLYLEPERLLLLRGVLRGTGDVRQPLQQLFVVEVSPVL